MLRRALMLLAVAVPAVASADTVATSASGPRHEGEYGGVVPGQSERTTADGRVHKKPPPKGTLAWVGFEAKNGGAELFFQARGEFEVDQHMEGSTLVVHLSLTRMGANAWRTLDTRYFDNPLSGATARTVSARRASSAHPARTRGIDVRIAFKNAKDAREGSLRTNTEPDGLYYAYLTFPEGTDDSSTPASVSEPER